MGEFWDVGDRVFAYWEEDEYYYPATITEITDDSIRIRFDDSDEEEWTDTDDMAEYSLSVGDAVEAFWEEDKEYYPGEVLEINGEDILVVFDEDGSQQWTKLGSLRMWYEDEEEEE
ncbi:MAG: DUF4537 domain-containing protein [Ardenticatenales bacterium]|nr:DUF4537 domain-containing protein [Ardenticatenales bacterium]